MTQHVTELLQMIMSLGYLGIALALMIEIIPSELVLAYGGFLITQGELNFYGVVLAGIIGGTFAQLFLYWMGLFGGRPFLEKYGKYLLLRKHHLDLSERWFNKYGSSVIFFARFIPVVRHAISIPAGIAKMSTVRFTFFTVLAIIPWSVLFIFIGQKLGENWTHIKSVAAPYVEIATIVIVVGVILVLVWKYTRRFRP
jgi:membrane protein DedA with SNARE-associated domain